MSATKKKTPEFSYGDSLADVGTEAWAKRVRVVLLDAVNGAQFRVHNLRTIIEQFITHRGWALLDTGKGDTYRHFRDFVSSPMPFGLGTDYDKFRSLLASELGEREFDRLTASEPSDAGRPSGSSEISASNADIPRNHRRTQQLRAINRAPALIQKLFDADLIAVDLAARFGPALDVSRPADRERHKGLERRAAALQSRVDGLKVFRPNMTTRNLKREVNLAAREILGIDEQSPLERIKRAYLKLSRQERDAFFKWMGEQNDGEI